MTENVKPCTKPGCRDWQDLGPDEKYLARLAPHRTHAHGCPNTMCLGRVRSVPNE